LRKTLVVVLALLGLVAWRMELFHVSRSGTRPAPLHLISPAPRALARVVVVLPQVHAGMRGLDSGSASLLIHYWAPWEHAGRAQAVALDSLRRVPGMEDLEVVLVCFDPFPSVARFVGRNRLRLAVLLDHGHTLEHALPCPNLPYTYVLDREGGIAVAQPGEVDWLADSTRRTLGRVLEAKHDRDPEAL
jgi:hypothetical protein